MPDKVCVARIGAAHGVRGAAKLWTFTEDPFAVKAYGPLSSKDGARHFELTSAREAKDHLVVTFKGVETRDEVKRLNGVELYVARDKLPATEEDEYYHADLIGLAAVDAAAEDLGSGSKAREDLPPHRGLPGAGDDERACPASTRLSSGIPPPRFRARELD